METKEQLIHHIKEWIKVDEEIKSLQKQIKAKRVEKKDLTGSLVDVMKTNEIDCFDINNGALVYTKNKVRSCLSKKLLLNALSEYYGDQPDEVEKLSTHILNSRKEVVKEGIRRKVEKEKKL